MSQFSELLADFKHGEFVIVTDDADRENEGDLILLAEKATTEKLAFMVRYTSGVICSVITQEIATKLKLPMMVARNEDNHSTAFTVSVDAIAGRTTGISAAERANTLRALASPTSIAIDFARPGHIFPLVAVPGGLHERGGHTEAGIALCELTNSYPSAVISELVNDDGTMMRGSELLKFAEEHKIKVTSIAELKSKVAEPLEKKGVALKWANLPLANGKWKAGTYIAPSGTEHALIKLGSLETPNLLTRIHSECLTGDVFGSLRCDCGPQLQKSIAEIEAAGNGLIIYMRGHEGRGIGLTEKIRAYLLQDGGQNTVEANVSLGHGIDNRSYDDAVLLIKSLGINSIELLTNNPLKIAAFEGSQVVVSNRAIQIPPNPHNQSYLATKRDLLAHTLGAN